MKKISLYILTALLSLTFVPMPLKASVETNMVAIPVNTNTESAEAGILLARVNEISAMDKSRLSSSEKRELRKEVRSTKKRLKELGGGIYLSVGAIIIILLILILLL